MIYISRKLSQPNKLENRKTILHKGIKMNRNQLFVLQSHKNRFFLFQNHQEIKILKNIVIIII